MIPCGATAIVVNNLVTKESDLVCAIGWLSGQKVFSPAWVAFARTISLAGRTRGGNKSSTLTSLFIVYAIGSLGNLNSSG